jgi:hypothetical protein
MSVQRKGASEHRFFQRHSQPLSNWAYVRKGGFFSNAVAAGTRGDVASPFASPIASPIASPFVSTIGSPITSTPNLGEFHVYGASREGSSQRLVK